MVEIEVREPNEFKEASELQWKPGEWPKTCQLGEICNAERGANGDLMFVDYEDKENEVVTRVFND